MQKFDHIWAIFFSVIIALILWFGIAHPRAVENSLEQPLKSVSFAPFRDGQSPLKEIFPTPAQVESDLILLKGLVQGIRTYTARGGLETVPKIAEKHGFHLTHSAWLGSNEKENTAEVTALINAANQYPQSIKRVIVGNEVLLRQDLKSGPLIAHIDRVRSAIKQPVSYADVWAFWLKYPEVADHVDYITIHILPYWEDEPISVEDTEKHIIMIIDIIKKRFPGKPILIGETGWPTEGRSRGPASANLVNAAQFVRHLPTLAETYDFDYNVVEAFDQTWKAQMEGTVGARWGLFDAQRHLKYALKGKIIPIDYAIPRIIASIVLGIFIAFLLLEKYASLHQVKVKAITIALWCQLFSASIVLSIYTAFRLVISPSSLTWSQMSMLFSISDKQWLPSSTITQLYELLFRHWVEVQAQYIANGIALFALLFSIAILLFIQSLLSRNELNRNEQNLTDNTSTKVQFSAIFCRFAYRIYCCAGILFALMFANSGRYMDIPLPHFLLPITAALGFFMLGKNNALNSLAYANHIKTKRFNRLLFWLLPLSALYCIYGEINAMMHGTDFINMHPDLNQQIPLVMNSILANHELIAWCFALILMALPLREKR